MELDTDIIKLQTSTGIQFLEKKKFHRLAKFFKKIFNFVFAPPNNKESIMGWVTRQICISDSSGNPSWTLTISILVVIGSFIFDYYMFKIALSHIRTFDATTGKLLSDTLKGFSSEYLYFWIVRFGCVTALYRMRAKDINGNETDESPVEKVIDTASSLIGKIKGGPPKGGM